MSVGNTQVHNETAAAQATKVDLEELKRQWLSMIDAMEDPLVIVNEQFTVQRKNMSYFKSAQAKGDAVEIRDLSGRKCYEVFAGRTSPCEECLLLKSLKEDRMLAWQTSSLFSEKVLEVRANPMPADLSTGLRRAVVQYRDVTQMRELQDSLARSDKLAALGKLAGGVAHEINSPLSGIMAFSQMALKEMSHTDPHREDMVQIEEAAKKCKVIVEGMLGFARQEPPHEKARFNLLASLQSSLALARPMLRKTGIELWYVPPAQKEVFVEGSQGKIDQVFLNLITNAIYAMKQGGTLEVIVDPKSDPGKVTVSVKDSGEGIDPQIMGKVFDPFFTTKPVGDGTGLGLSISYSIVKQHRGEISVTSIRGIGSTFVVTLPLI